MNTRKSIAIVAAMLITAAGMTGIANYSNAAADSTRAGHASVQVITTLPTINVSPSPEQLRELRDQGSKGGASAATGDARMPYYSFASDEAGA
ncbi:MAG: hypothetical protein OJF55_000297 [Rhodanobacteraceae bacterium]|jgi:hypothetical protein|nr:MAG: hypothetical protein OJF55_000297 [Rhodanobacteraceae bacterium]